MTGRLINDELRRMGKKAPAAIILQYLSGRIEKNTKISVKISAIGPRFKPRTSRKRSGSVNHSTVFGLSKGDRVIRDHTKCHVWRFYSGFTHYDTRGPCLQNYNGFHD